MDHRSSRGRPSGPVCVPATRRPRCRRVEAPRQGVVRIVDGEGVVHYVLGPAKGHVHQPLAGRVVEETGKAELHAVDPEPIGGDIELDDQSFRSLSGVSGSGGRPAGPLGGGVGVAGVGVGLAAAAPRARMPCISPSGATLLTCGLPANQRDQAPVCASREEAAATASTPQEARASSAVAPAAPSHTAIDHLPGGGAVEHRAGLSAGRARRHRRACGDQYKGCEAQDQQAETSSFDAHGSPPLRPFSGESAPNSKDRTRGHGPCCSGHPSGRR